MKSKFNLLKYGWKDFYAEGETFLNITGEQKGQIILQDNFNYVFGCLFYDITSDLDGGCILLNSDTQSKLLFEENSFIKCSTSKSCSAINIKSSTNCILSKICGYDCVATTGTHFCSIITQNGFEHINEVLDTSIVHSGIADSSNVLSAKYGSITVNNLNSSSNIASSDPMIRLEPTKNNPFYCLVFSSSFTNNTATTNGFSLITTNFQTDVQRCNFINNKAGQTLIKSDGRLALTHCCLLLNQATKFIETKGGSLLDTTIDFPLSGITSMESVKTAQTSIINLIQCYSTRECVITFDIVGKLTPLGHPTFYCFDCITDIPCKGNYVEKKKFMVQEI